MITVSSIANASEVELLCKTYEILMEDIKESIGKDYLERVKYIEHAKKVLKVLSGNLDFKYELANDLFDIYIYIQNLLINSFKIDSKLEEAYKLIDTIYQGYLQNEKNEKIKKPSIANAQSVYAGMTYGKGQLSEFTLEDNNRGYKA